MASSDWRLTDRLDRIEEKIDRLIALIEEASPYKPLPETHSGPGENTDDPGSSVGVGVAATRQ